MLLHNILIFFFLFSSLHSPPLSLSYSLIFLLFSFLKIFSLSFQISHSNYFLFLPNFFSLSSQFFLCRVRVSSFAMWVWVWWVMPQVWVSLTSWSCCGYGGSSVSGHAVGVGLCHGVRGSCCGGSSVLWFCGSCMPWGLCGRSSALCQAVGVGCRGFYFCGCGQIFLGSCGLILVVVVVACVKWWLTGGGVGLCEVVVVIVIYWSRYIILLQ